MVHAPAITHTAALKEWAVAVDALSQGKTILLLRKGGIREQSGCFSVEQSQVLLYPTWEHQKPHLLKPEYAQRVQAVESGWHPESVPIRAWAEITHIFQVSEAASLQALQPFHVWNEQFVAERFHWKPRQPLYLLLLRVYPLVQAQQIVYCDRYGGCKSWIELDLDRSTLKLDAPVLADAAYSAQVAAIQQAIQFSE